MSRIDYNNPHGAGELGLPYHYEMLSDARRVAPFKAAIARSCAGKLVFESGTGSGLLALMAARAGARKVYATELDPEVYAFARRNIEAAGFTNVELLHASTLDVCLDDIGGEPVDVVIAENLSTWFVTEPEVQVMNHITRTLAKPGALRLPSHVDNCVELCRSDYRFEDLVELRTQYFEFSGVPQAATMSDRALATRVAFERDNPEDFDLRVELRARAEGIVNGVRLSSPLELIPGVEFEASDSLMPPVVVPLERDLDLRRDERVALRIRYRSNTDWSQFRVELV